MNKIELKKEVGTDTKKGMTDQGLGKALKELVRHFKNIHWKNGLAVLFPNPLLLNRLGYHLARLLKKHEDPEDKDRHIVKKLIEVKFFSQDKSHILDGEKLDPYLEWLSERAKTDYWQIFNDYVVVLQIFIDTGIFRVQKAVLKIMAYAGTEFEGIVDQELEVKNFSKHSINFHALNTEDKARLETCIKMHISSYLSELLQKADQQLEIKLDKLAKEAATCYLAKKLLRYTDLRPGD